jgi:hypothetical protein
MSQQADATHHADEQTSAIRAAGCTRQMEMTETIRAQAKSKIIHDRDQVTKRFARLLQGNMAYKCSGEGSASWFELTFWA